MNLVRVDAVGRPKTENEELVTLRLSPEDLVRADRLRGLLVPSVPLTRSDALRAALRRGLDALEAEHAVPARASKKTSKR
jgi:hypothetical protein